MNLKLILSLLSNASSIAAQAERGITALRSLAEAGGASQADVQQAIAAGRAESQKLHDVADGILNRLGGGQ